MKDRLVTRNSLFFPVLVAIFIISIGILIHTGYKEGYSRYFSYAALLSPFLIVITPQRSIIEKIGAFILIVILVDYSSSVFWDYMDKPWFTPPEDSSCDGPCYGWFSFENPRPWLELYILGIIGFVSGYIFQGMNKVYSIVQRYFKNKKIINKLHALITFKNYY